MKRITILVAVLFVATMTPAQAAKKIPSTTVSVRCPDQNWNVYVTYKVEKDTLLKFASWNSCDNYYLLARWGYYEKGKSRRADVFVAPNTGTDLWKSELNSVIRKVGWINFSFASSPCATMGRGVKFYVANGDELDRHVCW